MQISVYENLVYILIHFTQLLRNCPRFGFYGSKITMPLVLQITSYISYEFHYGYVLSHGKKKFCLFKHENRWFLFSHLIWFPILTYGYFQPKSEREINFKHLTLNQYFSIKWIITSCHIISPKKNLPEKVANYIYGWLARDVLLRDNMKEWIIVKTKIFTCVTMETKIDWHDGKGKRVLSVETLKIVIQIQVNPQL